MDQLSKFYDNPANLVFIYSGVEVGDVFALKNHDKLWYRVKVVNMLDATHAMAMVQFLDYGGTQTCQLSSFGIDVILSDNLSSFVILSAICHPFRPFCHPLRPFA